MELDDLPDCDGLDSPVPVAWHGMACCEDEPQVAIPIDELPDSDREPVDDRGAVDDDAESHGIAWEDEPQAVIDELPDSDREPVNDDADSLFGNRSSQDDAVGEVAQVEPIDELPGDLLESIDQQPRPPLQAMSSAGS